MSVENVVVSEEYLIFSREESEKLIRMCLKDASRKDCIKENLLNAFYEWLNKDFANHLLNFGITENSSGIYELLSENKKLSAKELNRAFVAIQDLNQFFANSPYSDLVMPNIIDNEHEEEFEDFLEFLPSIESALRTAVDTAQHKDEGKIKKGRPSISRFKNTIWQAAIHYRKISNINPTFMRQKGDGDKYIVITPWHQFVSSMVETINPYMMKFLGETITDIQIVTACEYAVQKMRETFPDK